jgi:ADP-ribose pyrophosphatase YjhB (NUDIX family)
MHLPQVTPKVVTNALVFNSQREVLLVQRVDNELWCIPGGHMELGETLEEACKRELREETGLHGTIIRVLGLYSKPENSLHIHQGPEWHTVRISFLCRIVGGGIQLSPETKAIQYFPLDHLPPLITDHAQRIQDAFEYSQETIIK